MPTPSGGDPMVLRVQYEALSLFLIPLIQSECILQLSNQVDLPFQRGLQPTSPPEVLRVGFLYPKDSQRPREGADQLQL